MARYMISVEICSPDIIVEADSPEEAERIAEAFIEEGGPDYRELILSMDTCTNYPVELDPEIYECSYGIDSKNPFTMHNLDEEE